MKIAIPLLVLAGCVPDAATAPSFQRDVMPILAANCVRCHGYPSIGGAPSTFRLDSFSNIELRDDPNLAPIAGAGSLADVIANRVRGIDGTVMPPRFSLDDWQIETLVNWSRDPVRGDAHPDNRRPDAVIVDTSQVGAALTIALRITDSDGDLVAGQLRARVGGSAVLIGVVRSGSIDLVWDTTGLASGRYELVAHLDDGAQVHPVEVGEITVAP